MNRLPIQATRELPRGKPVRIDVDEGRLTGELVLPRSPKGLIIFTHGSGSSHHNHPRSQAVARTLEAGDIATLSMELLTEEEAHIDRITTQLRFEMDLLSARVKNIYEWTQQDRRLAGLKLGVYATQTAVGAVMLNAAENPDAFAAVVSRGGRPDLALSNLLKVDVPTMMIVGSRDLQTLELNRMALEKLGGPKRLEIVRGASATFEEQGAIERVSLLSNAWFRHYMNIAKSKPD